MSAAYWFYVSRKAYVRHVGVMFLYRPFLGTNTGCGHKAVTVHTVILLPAYHLYKLWMGNVTCPVPTILREVRACPFYFGSHPRDFPMLFIPHPSLITKEFHVTFPHVFSFDSKCMKQSAILRFSRGFSSICWYLASVHVLWWAEINPNTFL